MAANRGKVEKLTGGTAGETSPSLSVDGKRMAFESTRPGKRVVLAKKLTPGKEWALMDMPAEENLPRISRDGSQAAYGGGSVKGLYVVSFGGGVQRPACESCRMAWDWSTDGWMAFIPVRAPSQNQLFVAPVRGHGVIRERERVPVIDGTIRTDCPCWSPDGNLLYFLSPRDQFFCIWVQRLDRHAKRPVGHAQPVFHSHSARRSLHYDPDWLGLSVTEDRIAFTLSELTANIWMGKL